MSEPPDERFRSDFLDAAREGLEPTAADRVRLRRAIAAQIVGIATVTATTVGASAGTAAGGAAAGAAGAAGAGAAGAVVGSAGAGFVAKVVIGAVAASLAVGLGAMLARDREPVAAPMTVAVVEAGAAPLAPIASIASGAPIASGPALEDPPAAPAAPAPLARPAASRGASEGELTLETRLLANATEALRGGDPRAALTLLDEHRRRFPRGVLAEERDASRVFALCAMGSEEEATRSATQFAREHPRSGLGPRVARACAVR